MPGPRRFQYQLSLTSEVADAQPGLRCLPPRPDDAERLADLMLDAYRGTIDDDGETLDDARQEVRSYLGIRPLLEHSAVVAAGDRLQCACLISYLDDAEAPLVAYIMTRSAAKRRGLARLALGSSLRSLADAGYERVLATITEGNRPSETLFGSLGFTRSP